MATYNISKIKLPNNDQGNIKDVNAVTDITINGSSTGVTKTNRKVDLTIDTTSAGKKVEGVTFTRVNGTTVTAGTGAEQFNVYTTDRSTSSYTNIPEGNYSHAEGVGTTAEGISSHSEGSNTIAHGNYSHAEGSNAVAYGNYSHAEGNNTSAAGQYSHAEGVNSKAHGTASHAEGNNSAYGNYSHAEGVNTTTGDDSDATIGYAAHAEGTNTVAYGQYSHAEGANSNALGTASHAEGSSTSAVGNYSHAEGLYTTASSANQHVQGKYNISDTQGKYAHIIGCGIADNDRKNAYCIDWDGKIYQPQDPNADSNGVYLSNKQDKLTFDNNPIQNSDNPVKSNGIYTDIKNLEASFLPLESSDVMDMMTQSIEETSSKPLTNDEKPYVMTFIDYTDNSKSYTIGDVNNLKCYNKRRRCNLADDGTVNAYFGDSTFIENGTNGQVMVEQPKFYYKVEPVLLDNDGNKIRKCNYYISDFPLDGFKLHPAFIDRTDPTNLKEFPCIYIGAYEGCLQNGNTYITDDSSPSTSMKLSSIAYTSTANAIKPTSGVSGTFGTIANFVTTASNRGTGWCIENIWIASMNQLMFIIEMCNPNSQAILGDSISGISDTPDNANNASLIGSTSPLCNNSGKASATFSNYNSTTSVQYDSNKIAVSYRGMENPYGNMWTWIDGITIKNTSATEHVPYICKSFTYTRTSDTTNYDMVNVTVPGNGYVTAFGYDQNFDWLFMVAEISSANDGVINDYVYTIPTAGYTCALLGGCWNHADKAGIFYWGLNLWYGGISRNVGARICYLPGLSNE